MEALDCRGLDCPQPIIRTKAEIDKGLDEVAVRVDNEAASENVSNFLASQGFGTERERDGGDYLIHGQRTGPARDPEADPSCQACPAPRGSDKSICVMIATDRIGRGDDELGRRLMANYLASLKEMGPDLWRVILLNGGVGLAASGAESVKYLKELEESGVSVLVCGTCLEFFDLMDKKEVGETTNMLDVTTSLQVAGKVINIS